MVSDVSCIYVFDVSDAFHDFHVFHQTSHLTPHISYLTSHTSHLISHLLPALLVPPGLQILIPSAAFTREIYQLARLLYFIEMARYLVPSPPPDPLLELLRVRILTKTLLADPIAKISSS